MLIDSAFASSIHGYSLRKSALDSSHVVHPVEGGYRTIYLLVVVTFKDVRKNSFTPMPDSTIEAWVRFVHGRLKKQLK